MRSLRTSFTALLLGTAACAQRPRLTLLSLTPESGTSVTPDSTFSARVEYRIDQFKPEHWFLIIVYESVNGPRRTVTEGPDPRIPISDSTGILRIQQPFRIAWADTQIRRPFTLWIYLNEDRGAGHSMPLATLGPFIYKAANQKQ